MPGHEQRDRRSIGQTWLELRRIASIEQRMRHIGGLETPGQTRHLGSLRGVKRDVQRSAAFVLDGLTGLALNAADEVVPQRHAARAETKQRGRVALDERRENAGRCAGGAASGSTRIDQLHARAA